MKKNIVIVVLLLISLSSVTFSYYQKTLTNRALAIAEANELKAQQAEMQAMHAMEEAHRQRMMAEENMKKARAVEAMMIAELTKARKK